MELSFAMIYLGAMVGIVTYLVSPGFRAVVKDYRHYRWRLLVGILAVLILASWIFPLVVIKDTLSSAFMILHAVYQTSLRSAPYRPDASYFDYFGRLLGSFAVCSTIASLIFAWLIHCLVAMFRQRRD